MTDKQFVKGVYPDAELVRWPKDPALMTIRLEWIPPRNEYWNTYGWDMYKRPRDAWRKTRQEITKRMMRKLEA